MRNNVAEGLTELSESQLRAIEGGAEKGGIIIPDSFDRPGQIGTEECNGGGCSG